MAASPRSLALLLLVALAGAGCITGGYARQSLFVPVTDERLLPLHPGQSTLDDALRELGAPLLVWEWAGDGAALAWGWQDSTRWGYGVSVPVAQYVSASYTFDSLAKDLPGAVLFFGADGVLVESRRGKLGEIRAETARPRPAPVPEETP